MLQSITARLRNAFALTALAALLAVGLASCAVQPQQEKILSDDTQAAAEVVQPTEGAGVGGEAPSTTKLQINNLRDYYVDTASAKSATVMVYMCGADLETYSGAASKDLQEMVNAKLGNNVQIVIETGGAQRWHFASQASSRVRQRWMINDSGMYLCGEAGRGTILDRQAVTDFAKWAAEEYPADRYLFIFWDHGGGTIGGFGNDELYPTTQPLSLLDLRTALMDSGLKFDLVGFDACLMGTIETAYALEPVADYLLASEEYEQGDGWAWTGFLSALGANPSISTVDLGKKAIDDFADYYYNRRLRDITLSLIDLREVPNVYENLGAFLKAAEKTISEDNSRFKEMSQARRNARSFADGSIDQVDIIDLIERTNFDGRDELLAAVNSCIKYRCKTAITGANGLAMYFPYSAVNYYSSTRRVLNSIGFNTPTEFYDYFLSIMAGSPGNSSQGLVSPYGGGQQGQAQSGGASNGSYADSSYTLEDWFNQLFGMFMYEEAPEDLSMDYGEGEFIVPMDDAAWETFSSFHTTVMEEYGNGYLMLGRDDVYDQTEDGNIVLFYNGEWLTLGGQPVSFFSYEPTLEPNGEYSHSGVIPALLNGETQIEIVVYWAPQSQQTGSEYTGEVLGYRISNDANTFGRGYIAFDKGDVITPLFDTYDKQGNYVETVPGTDIQVGDEPLTVLYDFFDHGTVYFWGTLVTIYGDQIDTEVVQQ